jgi:tetrahydromethanopterin S-methyltransferase subunit B
MQTMTSVLSTVPDFVKLDDGTLVNRTVTTTQTDVPFDPAGIQPQIQNLDMADADDQGVIDAKTKAIADRVAQRDVLTAQRDEIASKYDDLKAILFPALTSLANEKTIDSLPSTSDSVVLADVPADKTPTDAPALVVADNGEPATPAV